MQTRVLLVRHAHTDAVGQRLLGRGPCPGLSESGRAQAAALADRLAALPLRAVHASPALRTCQTADMIADRHGLGVTPDTAFAEVDFGDWTGMTFSELDEDPTWRDYNSVRSVTRPPGGELALEVQARAVAGLLRLHEIHAGTTIAVVSHADVIRAVIGHVLGIPIDNLLRLAIEPGSISSLVFHGARPQVTGVNDCG